MATTSRPRRTGTARPAQAFLEHLRQPDHLGRAAASFGAFMAWNGWQYFQREQGGARLGALRRDRTQRTGGRRGPHRARAGRHAGQVRGNHLRPAGWPAGRQDLEREGQRRCLARGARWVAEHAVDPGLPGRRASCAWPPNCSKPRPTTRRSSNSRATCPRSSKRWWPTASGDIHLAQGKRDEAKAEYQKAWTAFGAGTDYRRLVEIKLNAVGVDPQSLAPAAAGATPVHARPHHEFPALA
jgi:hypothetical protein